MSRRSKGKIIFYILCALAMIPAAEFSLRVYELWTRGKVDLPVLIARRQEELLREKFEIIKPGSDGKREKSWENNLEIHPFFGYVYNTKLPGVNNFGFLTRYDILFSANGYYLAAEFRDPDKKPLVVGLFGGSFAETIGRESAYLERKLAAQFPGRTPVVMNFGIGTFAFPQTAFTFIYFRDLFDVVVFIDGLNEVWNPLMNNKMGFPPEYARADFFRQKLSRNKMSPAIFLETSRIINLQGKMAAVTRISLLSVLRSSLFVHYGWAALMRHWEKEKRGNFLAIKRAFESGGKFSDIPDEAITEFSVRQWEKYHGLVHTISQAQGIRDLHFLQPNPWVQGSKIFTKEETWLMNNTYPVKDFVFSGYPSLQRSAAKLKGKDFFTEDLSGIFRNVTEPVWADSCHVNQAGSRIILDRIAERIRESYAKAS